MPTTKPTTAKGKAIPLHRFSSGLWGGGGAGGNSGVVGVATRVASGMIGAAGVEGGARETRGGTATAVGAEVGTDVVLITKGAPPTSRRNMPSPCVAA
jgi:hypothetical protein